MCHFCVCVGGGGGKTSLHRIHLSGNFPLHTKLPCPDISCKFSCKAFLEGYRGLSAWCGSSLSLVRKTKKKKAHTSRGTCNNERVNSLKPDPCLCFYDLSQSEWLGKPSRKAVLAAFTEVSCCFLLINVT